MSGARRKVAEAVFPAETFIPGGILSTDRWHVKTNDGTCSRCGRLVPDDDAPLHVWRGDDMLTYCERCLKARPDDTD